MKNIRPLCASLASLCFVTATSIFAATDTWDGGGIDPALTTGENWLDDSTPLSDVLATDLIFTGTKQTSVLVDVPFAMHSILFGGGADVFTLAGEQLTIGAGGITNDSARPQQFISNLVLAAPAVTFRAAGEALAFAIVDVGAGTLTLNGDFGFAFAEFAGTGHVLNAGNGSLRFGMGGVENFDLTIASGGAAEIAFDGAANVFGASSAIAITKGSLLSQDDLVLDGATLTRAATSTLAFAPGRSFSVQGAGVATFEGGAVLTAKETFITGNLSTLAVNGGPLSLAAGSALFLSDGGRAQLAGGLEIGAAFGGSIVSVDAAQITVAGTSLLGAFGGAANMVFKNAATGTFAEVNLGTGPDIGSTGAMSLLGGSTVTSGNLSVGTATAANTSGNLSIEGAGSVWTQTVGASLTIGAASGGSGGVTISNGAVFHTNSGGITIAPTGVLTINGGGIFNANANVLVDGGQVLNPPSGSVSLNLALGKTITVQNGGKFGLGNALNLFGGSDLIVTGAGTQVTGGFLSPASNGATVTIDSGASVALTGTLQNTRGVVTVTGAGTQFSSNGTTTIVGSQGGVGTLTFSNGASGVFNALGGGSMDIPSFAGTGSIGTLQVQSGATVQGSSLRLGAEGTNPTGQLLITGAGSAFTQNSVRVNNIGTVVPGSGLLSVVSGGTFSSSSDGSTTAGPNGTISIGNNGAFLANDNLTLDGGQLTRSNTGVFTLAPARLFKIQNGGDANISGNFSHNAVSNIAVGGAGSTLNFNGVFTATLGGGVLVVVDAGAALTSGGTLEIGTAGNGSVSVVGAGTMVNGAGLRLGGNGATGMLAFDLGATATFGSTLLSSTGADGQTALTVQGGASLTLGNVTFANASGGGFFNVAGAGSTVTLSGTSALSFGATTNGTAVVNVNNAAVFNTGTSNVTIGANGALNLGGGTFNANGSVIVSSGLLSRTAGTFALGTGRSLTAQAGGDIALGDAALSLFNTSVLTVTGTGSTYSAGGTLTVFGSSAGFNVLSGGVATLSGGGVFNHSLGTVLVSLAGSQFNVTGSAPSSIGSTGNSAATNFRFGAAGNFAGGLNVPAIFNSFTNGTLNVESGAGVTSGNLSIASTGSAAAGATGTVVVTGAGSALTLNDAATLSIATLTGPLGTLNVNGGGAFTSGTGAITIGVGGTLTVTGGSFTALGHLTLDGGQLARGSNASSALLFPTGKNFTIQNGGDAAFTGSVTLTTGTTLITGAGSTFTTSGGTPSLNGGGVLDVLAGGVLSSGGALTVGTAGNGTVLVDGAGSSLTALGTSDVTLGQGGATGALTFTHNATGTLGGGLALASGAVPGTLGILAVQTGADVTLAGALKLAADGAGSATLAVAGSGSTFTQSGAQPVTLGAASGTTATLGVSSGGVFTTGTGPVALNATATVNITGGTVTFGGLLSDNGGLVNFLSGAFSYVGDLGVGPDGLLGDDLTLPAGKLLTLTGTTTIAPFHSLTLSGGLLSTGALLNDGTLDFIKGTLAVTGASGFEIGGGALGANVVLGTAATLNVTNALIVAGGGAFVLAGGVLSAGSLVNHGLVEQQSGVFSIAGAMQNHGELLVSRPLTIGGALANTATITLLAPAGRLNGAGIFSNNGLLLGSGTVAKPFTNATIGEVRAEAGTTLRFTGTTTPNAGRYTLQGGTVEFTQPFTNAASGSLSGRGTLNFAAGFLNQGALNFSGGFTDVQGAVAQNGTVIVSGGATGTFYGPVTHNGAEFRTSIGARSVFFATVNGLGSFTGTGDVYFEGGYSPGNSPAIVTLSTAVTFTPSNMLTMEIGGLTAGPGNPNVDDGYDKLIFTNAGNPMVTWGGTLRLDLINNFTPQPGQIFDLFDFDPARDASAFGQITLAAGDTLEPGLNFDFSQLYVSGSIAVVPEPSSLAGIALGVLLLGVRRRKLARLP